MCVETVEVSGDELADLEVQLRAINSEWDLTIQLMLNKVAVVAVIDRETADLLQPFRRTVDVRAIVRRD